MTNSRRPRLAADVALAFAGDGAGRGIALATVSTGTAECVVRLPLNAPVMPALDGREIGYAAVEALAGYLRRNNFTQVRIRVGDDRIAAELGGNGAPPPALAMAFVRTRCALRAVGSVRFEAGMSSAVRDLAARASAEMALRTAA